MSIQKRFALRSVIATKLDILKIRDNWLLSPPVGRINSGGASEQTNCPQNSQCLGWSQLLNEARTFFEQNPD